MLLNGIYAQLALVTLSLFWFALSNRRTHTESFIKVLSILFLLIGLWVGGVWVYPPVYGLLVIALVFFGTVFVHFRKSTTPVIRWRALVSCSPVVVIIPLACFLLWQGFTGRQTPAGEFIELDPPFTPDQGACVISGGISPLLNFHIFPSQSARDLAQQYALDIIKTRSNGFRTIKGYTLNPKPADASAYEMFDTPVISPCNGKVVEQENRQIDQPIGGSDKVRTSGNGVVLQCGDYHVHLHHMKRGSVLVELGDPVKSGQILGRIGNSGNTIEPHLHLHTETIVEVGDASKHGDPVHMSFDGKFMARGDCF